MISKLFAPSVVLLILFTLLITIPYVLEAIAAILVWVDRMP